MREGFQKFQATIAPAGSGGKVLWEGPGRCNQERCSNTLLWVNFFPAGRSEPQWQQIGGNQEPISADNEGLQYPHAPEDSECDALAAFPVVCIHFTSFPRWQRSQSDNGWAPIPSSQRVGGSPLAQSKLPPSPRSPVSQPSWAQPHSSGADRSDSLIYGGKITRSKNERGEWQKGWGPVELGLGFIGNLCFD